MAGTIVAISSTPANSQLCGMSYQLTADGDGLFDTLSIPGNVWIAGIEVVFDADTPPDALTLQLNTQNDLAKLASVTLTASGIVALDPAIIPFPFGVKIPFTGNTTVAAKAKVFFSIIRG